MNKLAELSIKNYNILHKFSLEREEKKKLIALSLDEKINKSIEILRQYTLNKNCELAFSGGKDSIVINKLVKMAKIKPKIFFSNTTLEAPEVYQFIRENYPNIEWRKTKLTMFQLISRRKIPPTRMVRYCCSYLKEIHNQSNLLILGIRWEESNKRKDRKIYEQSKRNPLTYYINPILFWNTKDIWNFINRYKLKYPILYDEGYERIGCIGCPLQSIKGKIRDFRRYPQYFGMYLKAFSNMLKNHKPSDKTKLKGYTPEQVMYWWVFEKHPKGNEQLDLNTLKEITI